MSKAEFSIHKNIEPAEAVGRYRFVKSDGNMPNASSEVPFGVLQDSIDADQVSNNEQRDICAYGYTRVACTDTTVSAGDLLMPHASNGSAIKYADDGVGAAEVKVAYALEGCHTSGQFIDVIFIPKGL